MLNPQPPSNFIFDDGHQTHHKPTIVSSSACCTDRPIPIHKPSIDRITAAHFRAPRPPINITKLFDSSLIIKITNTWATPEDNAL